MPEHRVSRIESRLAFCLILLLGCSRERPSSTRRAAPAGPLVRSPAADEDYFRDMDGGVTLSPAEVQGRNTWIVWTGGNDRFWDGLTASSFGVFDLLKIISSHPRLGFSRANRWNYFGLANEPCFEKATGPDPDRFGLWLDKRRADCPPDHEKPGYYERKELVRPYRVGMSCGFCHVGPNPLKPPADPENPKWENLSSNVGAQYFWVDRVFSWKLDPSNCMYQLLHASRPGSLDTSLISTDYINNPRSMNAVYQLGPRLEIGRRWGKETLAGGGLNNRQFNDFVKDGPLTKFFDKPATVWTPHVLKDGPDSVGALGALNRVYLNIGLFSEEWVRHFNPLAGGKPPRVVHVCDRPAPASSAGCSARISASWHPGPAGGRCLGLPPDSRLLHRQRGVHGRREGGGRDARRRRSRAQ